jgi:PKHD-type hydroxylase
LKYQELGVITMIICIANILTPEELETIVNSLEKAEFAEGKLTAGIYAKDVKNNTQLKSDTDIYEQNQEIVKEALRSHSLFKMAARPKTITPIIFSRYEEGMYYGLHTDNAIMGDEGNLIRTDLSMTLFLSPPSSYEGGELVFETTQGEEAFKLEAGSMIVYPTTTLHRVEPIRKGVRLAAVAWVQSIIRNSHQREILFDLETARTSLFKKSGKTPEIELLSKTLSNLLRLWAEI